LSVTNYSSLRHWGYRRRLSYRALEAWPTAASDYERRLTLPAATSAIILNADIRLRCTKSRNLHITGNNHTAIGKLPDLN
jgi:hypothetical protein